MRRSSMNLFWFNGDITDGSVGQRTQHRPLSLHRHPRLHNFAVLYTKFDCITVLDIFGCAEVTVLICVS